MAFKAVDQGAAGVDMGRNIFQSDSPIAMIKVSQTIKPPAWQPSVNVVMVDYPLRLKGRAITSPQGFAWGAGPGCGWEEEMSGSMAALASIRALRISSRLVSADRKPAAICG
jgi:hypothetical protein